MKKLIVLFTIFCSFVDAQNCCLDNTFGSGGVVTTAFPDRSHIRTIKVQPDGKIVAGGMTFTAATSAGYQFAFARYNSNGIPDNSFGNSGTKIFNSSLSYLFDIELQSDGKIVAVGAEYGTSQPDITIMRTTTTGVLDNTFGGTGIVTVSLTGSDYAQALTIQQDGKYLMAGEHCVGPTTVMIAYRCNTNGTPDNTFGTNGTVQIQPGGSNETYANDVIQLADGTILLGGSTRTGTNMNFCIAKISATGTLVNTFGTNGIAITTLTPLDDDAYAMAVQSDGKILLAGRSGYQYSNPPSDFAMVRYNANGTIDNTFGTNGIVVWDVDQGDIFRDIEIQADGKIVVGGTSNGTFITARFNSNGTFDNSFGNSGVVTTTMSMGVDAFDIALQSDGNVLIAGATGGVWWSSNTDFCVARILGTGTPSPNVIMENSLNVGLNVFPNPTSLQLQLHLNNLIKECTVFNVLAAEVFHEEEINSNDYSLNVANLQKGMYYIEIRASNGDRSTTKFLKE